MGSKSIVWYFFTRDYTGEIAECAVCLKTMKCPDSSSSSLSRHLMRHGIDCKKIRCEFNESREKLETYCDDLVDYKRKFLERDNSIPTAEVNKNNSSQTGTDFATSASPQSAEDKNRSSQDFELPDTSTFMLPSSSLKSDVWKFFKRTISKNKAECMMCSRFLKITEGSTSALRRHLTMKHSIDLKSINYNTLPTDAAENDKGNSLFLVTSPVNEESTRTPNLPMTSRTKIMNGRQNLLKLKKNNLKFRNMQNHSATSKSDDDDELFFRGLQPAVKKLNLVQKLKLRSKITSWLLENIAQNEHELPNFNS